MQKKPPCPSLPFFPLFLAVLAATILFGCAGAGSPVDAEGQGPQLFRALPDAVNQYQVQIAGPGFQSGPGGFPGGGMRGR